ncbi:MAG: hypothetical protein QNK37_20645 [Acidobacteriota bacterium]|nr:hypothetical protein [Acidobacteriota bacterium]
MARVFAILLGMSCFGLMAIALMFLIIAPDFSRYFEYEPPKPIPVFSEWNGRHYDFAERVKFVLNDPASFQHVETRHMITDEGMVVIMKFRAKNAFNATVTKTWKALYSSDGRTYIRLIEK